MKLITCWITCFVFSNYVYVRRAVEILERDKELTNRSMSERMAVAKMFYSRVLVIVTEDMMPNFKDKDSQYIKDYYDIFFYSINRRYQSIKSFHIEHTVVKILTSATYDLPAIVYSTNCATKLAITSKNIETYSRWLYKNKENLPMHEIAVVFLNTKLQSSGECKEDIRGVVAAMNGLCVVEAPKQQRRWNFAFIYDYSASYFGTITGAHELGHLYNAFHDGDGKNKECSLKPPYLMAPEMSTSVTLERFSRCSEVNMNDNGNLGNCLLHAPTSDFFPKAKKLPGSMISITKQCMLEFQVENIRVTESQIKTKKKRNDFCLEVECRALDEVEDKSYITETLPMEGTACDINKWCVNGRCEVQSEIQMKWKEERFTEMAWRDKWADGEKEAARLKRRFLEVEESLSLIGRLKAFFARKKITL